jgi:LPS export ABC transporter protein LptC
MFFLQSIVLKSIQIGIFCMLFFSCRNDMDVISAFEQNDTIPVESGVKVEYFYSEFAILKTKMTALLMNRYEMPEPYIEFPKGFMIEMYDSAGNISSTISANWARRYEGKQLFEARYDVVVVDKVENKVLNTNYLIWDERQNKIFSDQFVKITTPDKIIFGDGFESDQEFNEYKILQPKGEILLTRNEEEDAD